MSNVLKVHLYFYGILCDIADTISRTLFTKKEMSFPPLQFEYYGKCLMRVEFSENYSPLSIYGGN